ncbi:MAG TPA: hypothetical protein DEO85_06015 [Maritimibacter sp.]|nr:hypothetical protein [Maritimibacter sp.]
MYNFQFGAGSMKRILAAAGVTAALMGSAKAETFTYGAYMAPSHPFHDRALEPLIEDFEADPAIEFNIRLISGGQLLGARESLEGVKNRLADLTFVVPVYNRTELPEINFFFQHIAFGPNVVAGTGAMLEAMYLNCPECIENYTAHNTVPLATGSGGQYHIYCKDPVESVEDMQGRKVRAVGAHARFVQLMGATPLNLPANEGVTAIQRGTLDCIIGPLAWMTSFGYVDTAPHILTVPMGYPKGLGLMVMNQDRWSNLSDESRAAVLSHMGELSARATIDAYLKPDEELLSQAEELNLHPNAGDGSFEPLFATFSETEKSELLRAASESGVQNPKALMAKMDELYEKWVVIAEETAADIELVGAAYQREIFDKLDPSSFGIK